jgi:hypothetical protein
MAISVPPPLYRRFADMVVPWHFGVDNVDELASEAPHGRGGQR